MTVSWSRVRLGWTLRQCAKTVGNFSYQHRRFSDKSRPIVYQADLSPPSRAVRLTAAAIGIDIEVRNVNLLAGEHRSKEYIKMNPECTVPTLDDNGFFLWDRISGEVGMKIPIRKANVGFTDQPEMANARTNFGVMIIGSATLGQCLAESRRTDSWFGDLSHAIMCYLSDKYGKDDSLYPKDLQRRALINQRLHFESGVLFARLRFMFMPVIMRQTDTIPQEKLDLLDQAYELMDKFLEGNQWLSGDSYTLADISCVSSISSLQCFLQVEKYPNIKDWLKRCEDNLPEYAKINVPGSKIMYNMITRLVKS